MRTRRTTRSWIPDGLLLFAFAGVACAAPAAPPGPTTVHATCVERRALAAKLRRELDAGRLLRALPPPNLDDATCPDERRQLRALGAEAAAFLGDMETARRLGGEAAHPMFGPDAPVAPLGSPEEVRAAYGSAASAYLSGAWLEAVKLGLAVGAARGPLAAEGFILAARAAERTGDAARAARMWARAYRVGCQVGCEVQPPRDDLFGRAALLGRFVPWHAEMLCSPALRWAAGVVNGTWHVAPWEPAARRADPEAEAFDVREIPTRVLLDRVEAPPGAELLCFSPDGRRRIAVALADDGHRSMVFGAMGQPWSGARPLDSSPAPDRTYVANDGSVIVRDELGFEVFPPRLGASRAVLWPKGTAVRGAAVDGAGHLFVALDAQLGRYDLGTGKLHWVSARLRVDEVGPVSGDQKLAVRSEARIFWVDGRSGAVLGEVTGPDLNTAPAAAGIVRSAGLLWREGCGGQACFHAVDLATGVREPVQIAWRTPPDEAREREAASRALRGIVVGSPPRPWGSFSGWRASRVLRGRDPLTHVTVTLVEVKAEGRAPLSVVISADEKGAFILGPDGRFELVGQFSAAFRASASCGEKGTHTPPFAADRTWPLEVCGAALEEPGITARWLAAIDSAPVTHSAPPPR